MLGAASCATLQFLNDNGYGYFMPKKYPCYHVDLAECTISQCYQSEKFSSNYIVSPRIFQKIFLLWLAGVILKVLEAELGTGVWMLS